MRHLGLVIAVVSVAACSTPVATAYQPADAGPGVDVPAVTDTGAPSLDVSSPDVPATVDVGTDATPYTTDGGYVVPGGYTLTPFLADTPSYDFPMADMVTVSGRDYAAVIETDMGRMVLSLTAQQTPITVNSFVFLALHHFFDGIAFHRVIDGFVAQGGDPNTLMGNRGTWGTGGPGYMFGLEIVPSLRFDGPGVLGMARATSPDSNGSQFYITLAATPNLNGMYTVFGRVTDGLPVLAALTRGEPPTTPSRMTRVYIVERPH